MKKSDVEIKLFREGFNTYEYLSNLLEALRKAHYEIDRRLGNGLGAIEDKNDIFTDDEILRYQKLSNAITKASEDLLEKRTEYQKTLIYKNLRIDDEETNKSETDEDEFY